MNEDAYQYTETDVELALRFLRTNFPTYATPENAIKVLVYTHDQTKSIEDISVDEVEELLSDLESH